MNTTIAAIILLGVMGLGVTNLALLPFSFMRSRNNLDRLIPGVFIVAATVMCYFLERAGYISDAQGIGGDQVPPFFGTEWYFLLAVGILAIVFQLRLLKKSVKKDRN
jgi:hypothetical protein